MNYLSNTIMLIMQFTVNIGIHLKTLKKCILQCCDDIQRKILNLKQNQIRNANLVSFFHTHPRRKGQTQHACMTPGGGLGKADDSLSSQITNRWPKTGLCSSSVNCMGCFSVDVFSKERLRGL